MDKIIEKKKGIAVAFTKKALPYWFGAFMAALILWLVLRDDASTLRVNGETLSISEVLSGVQRLYPHQRTGTADDHYTNKSSGGRNRSGNHH